MQSMVPFVCTLVNVQLTNSFLISLCKDLFQYLAESFLSNVMEYGPAVAVLFVYVCSTFEQYVDWLNLSLFLKCTDCLQ